MPFRASKIVCAKRMYATLRPQCDIADSYISHDIIANSLHGIQKHKSFKT